jgi:hypothetical protein
MTFNKTNYLYSDVPKLVNAVNANHYPHSGQEQR